MASWSRFIGRQGIPAPNAIIFCNLDMPVGTEISHDQTVNCPAFRVAAAEKVERSHLFVWEVAFIKVSPRNVQIWSDGPQVVLDFLFAGQI